MSASGGYEQLLWLFPADIKNSDALHISCSSLNHTSFEEKQMWFSPWQALTTVTIIAV
jgi:hypothetical protein